MSSSFLSSVLALLLVSVLSSVRGYTYPERCPRIIPVQVDTEKFTGTWYDFEHNNADKYACAIYTNKFLTVEGEPLPVQKVRVITRFENGTTAEETEHYRILNTLEGEYSDKITSISDDQVYNYFILDTDYTTYSINYFCGEEEGKDELKQHVSFTTRTGEIDEELRVRLRGVLQQNNIDIAMESQPDKCQGLAIPILE